ncbi:MAG: hypothetical protein AAGJ09_09045 [Pseudomonadota bacterium]
MADVRKNVVSKIIGTLWFLWALLHILPGLIMVQSALSGDISSIKMLFPETDPDGLSRDYADEVRAILVTFGQHGFNLFWFGLVALVGSFLIFFYANRTALITSAIVIGLADLGALFATFMIGKIDVFGVLIFAGTVLGVVLTVLLLKRGHSNP